MIRSDVSEKFTCAMRGDPQPHSKTAVSYVHDGVLDASLAHDSRERRVRRAAERYDG